MRTRSDSCVLSGLFACSLLALVGCGSGAADDDATSSATETGTADTNTDTDTDTGTEGANQDPCPKLQVRLDGDCSPVVVNDVTTEDVAFVRDGWTLRGTLYTPQVDDPGYEPLGAVIFHGSGPQGRQGLIGQMLGITYDPPFPAYASLADQLARRGFAVLTYDKRSCFAENSLECELSASQYPGDPNLITLADFIADGRAAAQVLHEALGQDVVLIGHSQGGLFVPLIADEPGVCGVVMLAGATLSLIDTIVGQLNEYADYLESIDPTDPLIQAYRDAADEALLSLTQIAEGTFMGANWQGGTPAFWLEWMQVQDGLEDSLVALERPLFAAFAGADFNVGPAHRVLMEDWVSMGVPAQAVVQSYPEHTHIFVELQEAPPGYGDRVSDVLVDDIAGWVGGVP